MKPTAQTFTLTSATAVEVLPGLRMGVGHPNDGHQPVTFQGSQLVFDDPPHVWDIEREAFFDRKMRDLFRTGALKQL
jgi:hypothetical protein